MNQAPDIRLGPPRIFIPVCKHPRDYMFTFGPLGYIEVEVVMECPICVSTVIPQKEKP